jgi:simple sugar transport system permease protein
MRSVGINKPAAESLGIRPTACRYSPWCFPACSRVWAGCPAYDGRVTLFAQNITAGRGFIAMAAGTLGAAHPLGVIVSSAFFGFAQVHG